MRALEVTCVKHGAEAGTPCHPPDPIKNGGAFVVCQSRINAAVKASRDANRARREAAKR